MTTNGIAGYLVGAVIAAAAGGICLAAASFEGHMADAQQSFATGDYDRSAEALEEAGRYAAYVRWLPWVGRSVADDLRTRAAALQYWRGEYTVLAGAAEGPITTVDPDNVDLQLVVANAAYRVRQPRMTERMNAVRALDELLPAYLNVLKHQAWREDAAYNYEYLARLRDDLARNRRRPPGSEAMEGDRDALGAAGMPTIPAEGGQFEIYVPLEQQEREEGEAGRTETRPRRG
jgi:hypothetical protein